MEKRYTYAPPMHRINTYITETHKNQISALVKLLNKRAADIIRDAISEYTEKHRLNTHVSRVTSKIDDFLPFTPTQNQRTVISHIQSGQSGFITKSRQTDISSILLAFAATENINNKVNITYITINEDMAKHTRYTFDAITKRDNKIPMSESSVYFMTPCAFLGNMNNRGLDTSYSSIKKRGVNNILIVDEISLPTINLKEFCDALYECFMNGITVIIATTPSSKYIVYERDIVLNPIYHLWLLFSAKCNPFNSTFALKITNESITEKFGPDRIASDCMGEYSDLLTPSVIQLDIDKTETQ